MYVCVCLVCQFNHFHISFPLLYRISKNKNNLLSMKNIKKIILFSFSYHFLTLLLSMFSSKWNWIDTRRKKLSQGRYELKYRMEKMMRKRKLNKYYHINRDLANTLSFMWREDCHSHGHSIYVRSYHIRYILTSKWIVIRKRKSLNNRIMYLKMKIKYP